MFRMATASDTKYPQDADSAFSATLNLPTTVRNPTIHASLWTKIVRDCIHPLSRHQSQPSWPSSLANQANIPRDTRLSEKLFAKSKAQLCSSCMHLPSNHTARLLSPPFDTWMSGGLRQIQSNSFNESFVKCFDHNKPFHVYCDTCDYQLGADYLSRRWARCRYHSCKLNGAQRNYTVDNRRKKLLYSWNSQKLPKYALRIQIPWCLHRPLQWHVSEHA